MTTPPGLASTSALAVAPGPDESAAGSQGSGSGPYIPPAESAPSLWRCWERPCSCTCGPGTALEAVPEHPLLVAAPLALVQLGLMAGMGADQSLQSGRVAGGMLAVWACLQLASTGWFVGLAWALIGSLGKGAAGQGVASGVGEGSALLGPGASGLGSRQQATGPGKGSNPAARGGWCCRVPCCVSLQRRGLRALGVRFLLESGATVALLFGTLYVGLYLVAPQQPAFAMDDGHHRQPHPRLQPEDPDGGGVGEDPPVGEDAQPPPVQVPSFSRLVPYLLAFSVTTLTGTGYGSVYPSGWYTRLAVGAEMIASILFVVVFLGLGYTAVTDAAAASALVGPGEASSPPLGAVGTSHEARRKR